jgi:3-hydroxyisobutyrate dehydrogenase-like beta-hydroxyacid dehydrogenase
MRIGFIGMGDMGSLIIPRLMEAGHAVTGWNRTRARAEPLIDAGMAWADSPREGASGCEAVISIVTDGAAVRAVALGDDGVIAGLGAGGIFIDMSTIDPGVSMGVAKEFARAGLTMLDAPLSGSPVTVRAGTASIMVGGDEAAYERARPVLLAIGPKVARIGGQGLAVRMKVAINLCLIVEMVAFGEAVALAEKGGVERAVAVEAMLASVVASPVMSYRGPFILEGQMPDKPLANVALQQKDALLALDLARRDGVPAPLIAAANEMLNAARGLGLEHRDFVTVFDVYRRMGGMGE